MLKRHFFIISLMIIMISCGNNKESSNRKKVRITPDQVANMLENQHFECAPNNGERCPAGVVRVFVLDLKDPDDSGLCTGFLTSSNRLVTNHHCISNEEECSSSYFSIFNGDDYETAKCKKIIKAVDDGKPLSDKAIDFSVIELDKHIRTSDVFTLAPRAPSIGHDLTAWVVDHIDIFNARITELNCSLIGKENSFELDKCPAISGNSGSPVVNENKQIIGVLWGSTTGDNVNETMPLPQRRILDDYAYVTELRHFRQYLRR